MEYKNLIIILMMILLVGTNIFWIANDGNLRYWIGIKDKDLQEKDRQLKDNNYWLQIKDEQLQEKDRQLGNQLIQTTKSQIPEKYITVRYSFLMVYKFRDKYWNDQNYIYPKPGNIFLVITFYITNVGYQEFSTGGTDWILSTSTQDNPNTYSQAEFASNVWGYVDREYKGATIENGGYYEAQVPYEVPVNLARYKLKYNGIYDYNIRWVEN